MAIDFMMRTRNSPGWWVIQTGRSGNQAITSPIMIDDYGNAVLIPSPQYRISSFMFDTEWYSGWLDEYF